MKLKKLWIPALILTLLGGAAKICDTVFNVNGSGFFLNSYVCNSVFVAAFLLLFIIGYGMSIADRKKQFKAEVRKDIMCGVFGFIASVMIIAVGVITLLAFDGSKIAECIFAIAGGGILLYESCISFTGQNGMKRIPVAGLLLPVWACLRFISLFSVYNQTSLHATELFDIVAVAFLIMFLFYQAMFFAGINNSVAVRKSVVYGTVFVMLSLVVSADLIIKMIFPAEVLPNIDTQIVKPTLISIMTIIGDLAMCGYALFFMKDVLRAAESTLASDDEDELSEDELIYGGSDKKEPAPEKKASVKPAVSAEKEDAADGKTREFKAIKNVQEPVKKDAPKAEKTEPAKKDAPKAEKTEPVKAEEPKEETKLPEEPENDTYDQLMQMLDDLSDSEK